MTGRQTRKRKTDKPPSANKSLFNVVHEQAVEVSQKKVKTSEPSAALTHSASPGTPGKPGEASTKPTATDPSQISVTPGKSTTRGHSQTTNLEPTAGTNVTQVLPTDETTPTAAENNVLQSSRRQPCETNYAQRAAQAHETRYVVRDWRLLRVIDEQSLPISGYVVPLQTILEVKTRMDEEKALRQRRHPIRVLTSFF